MTSNIVNVSVIAFTVCPHLHRVFGPYYRRGRKASALSQDKLDEMVLHGDFRKFVAEFGLGGAGLFSE